MMPARGLSQMKLSIPLVRAFVGRSVCILFLTTTVGCGAIAAGLFPRPSEVTATWTAVNDHEVVYDKDGNFQTVLALTLIDGPPIPALSNNPDDGRPRILLRDPMKVIAVDHSRRCLHPAGNQLGATIRTTGTLKTVTILNDTEPVDSWSGHATSPGQYLIREERVLQLSPSDVTRVLRDDKSEEDERAK